MGSLTHDRFIFKVGSRNKEIHLMNYPSTDLANTSIFGVGDDDSVAENNEFYQTQAGLPWALDIPASWAHPYERTDTSQAYPDIKPWAESGGVNKPNWHANPNANKTW